MDALEIMANLDRVVPYFQPIFSADEHSIIGYEVLGRYLGENGPVSLGDFFEDEEVPDEFRLEADNHILRQALNRFMEEEAEGHLFINRDARLLMMDKEEEFLNILLGYKETGLDLHKIVLEISEKKYTSDLEHLLQYYKTFGIQIAIDHIGEENVNIHKFTGSDPDILKVSLQALRHDAGNRAYKDILHSLSILARKIGASLLFEKIEIEFQLQYAWKHGGRYYQGCYLQEPIPGFLPCDVLKEKLRRKFQEFILHEKRMLEKVYLQAESIQNDLQTLLPKLRKQTDSRIELLKELAAYFDPMCFRFYICDENGFEVTPNLLKKDGEWIVQPEYLNKNWSWRPYFLENILRMRKNRTGLLSDLYSDLETGEIIRTFSYPVNDHEYLFMDITYDYLYEHDGLLY
ncbi:MULTISPECIES: EAL domain-containing protein [Bacillus]|jgi:EAL domain-containing protein (putative c-di-GMP-specific phosphodiesterase class I)|uniref:EAL domain-containing protein n=1 Tax=Bacillus smithii 7_3_47FAA TaxID=665952 RepID=G9QM92_9BACI|nr:EAL-associated domain-containing protein [Bacillus smithii]EHL77137.1 hypothetical protein HMPREF1015_00659 [Bacillus smithii 7_3_47FAA]MED0660126.1 EAL-associated domain-containing protein [Bacillus smithii]MED1419583.1 EAL-associated domain-containing protein [Bacillus smithii]MED1455949.1 EAL-associated domain-containing protein [Bacillus smithii]MED1488273.1 EAL-associated domain-containing protein [Bacillus smithii]